MQGTAVPEIRNSKMGIIVRHSEYLGDIFTPGSVNSVFTNRVYPINPGLPGSFPWLSTIANSFEQYQWRGLIYTFKSMSSDNVLSAATSSALGSVIMGTDYDVYDAPYSSKAEMENAQFSNSCKPSRSMMHPIECATGLNPIPRFWTRNQDPPAGADLRLYDIGNFQIATEGQQGSTVGSLGELWTSYEIEFFKPQVDVLGNNIPADHFFATGTNYLDPTVDAPMKNATKRAGSFLGTTLTNTVGPVTSRIDFPRHIGAGRYMCIYSMQGTVEAVAPGLTGYTLTGSNCTPVADWSVSGNTSTGSTPGSLDALNTLYIFQVDVTASPAFFTIEFAGGGKVPTGTQSMDFWILQQSPLVF